MHKSTWYYLAPFVSHKRCNNQQIPSQIRHLQRATHPPNWLGENKCCIATTARNSLFHSSFHETPQNEHHTINVSLATKRLQTAITTRSHFCLNVIIKRCSILKFAMTAKKAVESQNIRYNGQLTAAECFVCLKICFVISLYMLKRTHTLFATHSRILIMPDKPILTTLTSCEHYSWLSHQLTLTGFMPQKPVAGSHTKFTV